MQWSKIKKKIESGFADSVADRVRIQTAGYRWHHEAEGRIWITVDGEEVANFCSHRHWNERREQGESQVNERGLLQRSKARDDLESYADLSIEEALASPSPLHLAVAVLDRRLGKRRLVKLELPARAPDFVHRLFELRMRSEGLERHLALAEAGDSGDADEPAGVGSGTSP